MKNIFVLAVAASVICSCSTDDTQGFEPVEKTYREFTASIDDFTRLELNNDKTAAYWEVGDEIALSDGSKTDPVTVIAINDGVATIAGNISIEPTAAYYPAWAYDADGSLALPKEQTYGKSLPLCLKGTVLDNNISFSASDNGAAVIRYAVKGDIVITKAIFHAAQNQKIVARNENQQDIYTMTFESPLDLNDGAAYLDFVIPASVSRPYYTLEVETSSVPEDALATTYSLVRRKVSAMTDAQVKSGAIVAFPELEFQSSEIAVNGNVWMFGSKYAVQNDNGLINDWGQCTAANNSYGLGINKLCRLGTQHEEYVTIDDAQKQGTPSVGANQHTFRLNIGHGINNDKRVFDANIGNYRFFAIKWSAPKLLADAKAVNTKASIKLDHPFGGFRNAGDGKTGEIECQEENVVIWYYNLTDEAKSGQYLSTTAPTTFNFLSFKVSDFTFNDSTLTFDGDNVIAPSYDLYWAGFFNSVDEIKAFEASLE